MTKPVIRLTMSDVFKSFKVDLRKFHKNRVYVQHHLHTQPSEIDSMPFYEYQWMVTDLVEMLKEQNGDGEKNGHEEMANEQMSNMKNTAASYTKGFGSGMKMPKMKI